MFDNFEDGDIMSNITTVWSLTSHTHQRSKPYLAMFVNNLIREGAWKRMQIVGFNSIDYKNMKDPKCG